MQVDKNCNATTQVQTNVTPPLVTATNNQNQSESHKLNAQQLAYNKQAIEKGSIVTTPVGKVNLSYYKILNLYKKFRLCFSVSIYNLFFI